MLATESDSSRSLDCTFVPFRDAATSKPTGMRCHHLHMDCSSCLPYAGTIECAGTRTCLAVRCMASLYCGIMILMHFVNRSEYSGSVGGGAHFDPDLPCVTCTKRWSLAVVIETSAPCSKKPFLGRSAVDRVISRVGSGPFL